ncbi:MAG: F0F1 ATP synthase subunit B [Myxococcota bacterium]
MCLVAVRAPAQEHAAAGHAPDAPATHAADATGHNAADAHDGDAGHGPEYDLLTLDGLTAVWTIVIFIILVIVLRLAAWKPIQGVLAEREQFITNSLAQAKKDREEADARLKEYTARLEAARGEAKAIVEEGRRDAEVVKQRVTQEAQEQASAIIDRAKREIALATDTAIKELYTRSARLATHAAGRIIRKELDPAGHEQLIAESIEELEKVG